MKKISFYAIISLFTVLLLSGCNSESMDTDNEINNENSENDNKDTETSETKLLPSVIKSSIKSLISSDYSNIYELEYDSNNRIVCIKNYFQADGKERVLKSTIDILYDGNDMITEKTIFDSQTIKETKTYRYNKDKINFGENKFIEIDKNMRVLSIEQNSHGPCLFTYDEKGNAVSFSYHAWDNEKTKVTNFIYDTKNVGVFRYVKTPSWFIVTQLLSDFTIAEENKITYQNIYDNCIEAKDGDYTIYKYEYECNSDNYPVKIEEKPVGVLSDDYLSFKIEYIESK